MQLHYLKELLGIQGYCIANLKMEERRDVSNHLSLFLTGSGIGNPTRGCLLGQDL